jgi:hypothetical protein
LGGIDYAAAFVEGNTQVNVSFSGALDAQFICILSEICKKDIVFFSGSVLELAYFNRFWLLQMKS